MRLGWPGLPELLAEPLLALLDQRVDGRDDGQCEIRLAEARVGQLEQGDLQVIDYKIFDEVDIHVGSTLLGIRPEQIITCWAFAARFFVIPLLSARRFR